MNVGDTSVKGMFLLTIESHSCSRLKQAEECCLNNRTSGDEKNPCNLSCFVKYFGLLVLFGPMYSIF